MKVLFARLICGELKFERLAGPFRDGFTFKGVKTELCRSINEKVVEDFDAVVTWGYFNKIKEACKNIATQYLIIERAYLGLRAGLNHYTSLAVGGLNGRGVFSSIDKHSSDRRKEHFPNLFSNYTNNYDPTGHIIIAAQVPYDKALLYVPDETKNYSNMIRDVSVRFPGKKIIFRPHPIYKRWCHRIKGPGKYDLKIPEGVVVDIDKNENIEDTFKGAKALVTINSNAGLLARIAGLEVYDYDIGSMSYSVNKRINEEWWTNKEECKKMIVQLCNNIAHFQYTPDEIKIGLPWDNIIKIIQTKNKKT